MNRAAALILALAVAAAGLGYVLLQDPDRGNGAADPPAGGAADRPGGSSEAGDEGAEPATLAEVEALSRGAAASVGGTLDSWRIIPMNHVGQSWQDARITATRGGEALEGVGSTEFEDVEAGAWDVVVEVTGQPTWRRTVDLPAGRSEKTFAYVGEELRVAGRLVDATETPVGGEYVHFMPRGVPLPTAESFRTIAGTQPGRSFQIGAIHGVRTASSGRFRSMLPAAGEYRVAVGRPGDLRWIQDDLIELTHGGPDHVEVVVPRSASFEIRFEGAEDARPTTITAYAFDAELAQRILTERPLPGTGRVDVQAEQKRLARQARQDGAGGTDGAAAGDVKAGSDKLPKPLGDANRATFERNMEIYGEEALDEGNDERASAPLFEPGWRPVGTARFDGDGVARFDDLPPGEALRFLVIRTRERATTPGTLILAKESHSVGRLSMGPVPPENSNRMVRRDDVSIRVTVPEAQDDAPLEVGAHWVVKGS